ncbi:threonine--tRNA ligase [Candidatus Woesearchaeota archaeon]|nr:threonine--tRNA ligase [Candidatus Woesearchaeota archaeon]
MASHESSKGFNGKLFLKVNGEELVLNANEKLGSVLKAKDCVLVKINEKVFDLQITGFELVKALGLKLEPKISLNIECLNLNSKEAWNVLQHSAAHVLAYAVQKLYPEALNTIGPSIEEGFYYDFDNLSITSEDLKRVEEEMKKIVKANHDFERKIVSKQECEELFKNNAYKLELVNEFASQGEQLTIYKCGDFIDLCKGPHLPSTGFVKAFKLLKISGAYWRGDAKNKQLTRIYGVAFFNEKELKKHLAMLEERAKRDHRKIAKDLDLFSISEYGPGFIFWHPKGARIYNALISFSRAFHNKAGYLEIKTPLILSAELWKRSGHWDHYKENMYFTKIDDREFAVKPMNCPGAILVYKSRVRSYKEFPLKLSEFGFVHRHELSGVLSGLFRVRAFTQDDAHIFCTEDQIEQEIMAVLKLIDIVYKMFGFKYYIALSTRPQDYMGSLELWDKAENALKNALKNNGLEFTVNEGEGAFYGPKIDFEIEDCIGRRWQCATIQLDFQMPERFDLKYMGKDGTTNHRPVMIHRVIYGSVERFIGILLEHYAGKLPLWLSPDQVRIIPVSENFNDYAMQIFEKLKDKYWCSLDDSNQTVSKKIRQAQLDKVNYVLVVGEKEQAHNTVNVRSRDKGVIGELKLEEFEKMLDEELNILKQTLNKI